MLPLPPHVTSSALAILSPGYPSTPGGVTDHTQRLQGHWSASGHTVRVIGDAATDPDVLASDLASASVRAVLIQYVPFLYARRGVTSWPERFARAARARGIRITVFVHEPWVPMTRLPWLVLGSLQRRQLLRLAGIADRVVTAVPAWQSALGRSTELVYVSSNLGPVPPGDRGSPLSAPVVFSPTAAGLRFDWIAAAARAIGCSPGLVLIGTDAAEGRGNAQIAPHFVATWDWRGRVAAGDALRLLARARLVLAPFDDGATGRRTSMLAAVSTGARVLSSTGPLLDPVFQNSPVILASSQAEFVEVAVRTWSATDGPVPRESRLAWYRTHMDPDELDARLLRVVTGQA